MTNDEDARNNRAKDLHARIEQLAKAGNPKLPDEVESPHDFVERKMREDASRKVSSEKSS